MKIFRISGCSGYTLVELLIAVVLLAIGFFAVITVLWSSTKGGTTSRNMTAAANVAQDIFERLSGVPAAALPSTSGFVPYTAANPAAGKLVRQWQVEDGVPEAGMKTITVKISWNEQGIARTRTYTMVRRGDF